MQLIRYYREHHGVNTFLRSAKIDEMGGLPKQAYYDGIHEITDDEALILETELPTECRYWQALVGDDRFCTVDWVNRQSSLNDVQAHLDGDGRFRAVISRRDPGVPNWLDKGDYPWGIIQMRFFRADEYPVPSIVKVPFDELAQSPARRHAGRSRRSSGVTSCARGARPRSSVASGEPTLCVAATSDDRRQGLPAAGHVAVGEARAVPVDVPGRKALQQLVDHDPSFQASQRHAQAEVRAVAEAEHVVDLATHVEGVGIREVALVAVRGSREHHQDAVGGDDLAVELGVGDDVAGDVVRRRLEPQDLVHRVRDERRVVDQALALVGDAARGGCRPSRSGGWWCRSRRFAITLR